MKECGRVLQIPCSKRVIIVCSSGMYDAKA